MTPRIELLYIDNSDFAVPSLASLSEGDNPVLAQAVERVLDDASDEGKCSAWFASYI